MLVHLSLVAWVGVPQSDDDLAEPADKVLNLCSTHPLPGCPPLAGDELCLGAGAFGLGGLDPFGDDVGVGSDAEDRAVRGEAESADGFGGSRSSRWS